MRDQAFCRRVMMIEQIRECSGRIYDVADGRPTFVDDAAYAVCPECGRKMMHLAQLGEEWTTCGTHYIRICRNCKIAAIQYQQT